MLGSGASARCCRGCPGLRRGDDGFCGLDAVTRDRAYDLGPVEEATLLLGRQAILDVLVGQDLVERAATLVLADHVACDMLLGGASLEEE